MSAQSAIFNPTQTTSAATGDGFSVPRLTTTGRLAITFTTADAGMMVYDTTLNNLFIWTGSAWESVPASGDAGANGAVQYNDNGVVSGAANFFWDKANNRVGIGTASPTASLDVNATQVKIANNATADITVLVGPDTPSAARSGRLGFITSSTQKNWYILNSWNTTGAFEIAQTTAAGGSTLSSNSTFRINSDSSFDFLDGAGGTRMTLNSTGLGVGVTPSAWVLSGYKAFEVGVPGNGVFSGNGDFNVSTNAYYSSGWKYAVSTVAASSYQQNAGQHIWKTAASGTAGNAITFTQAMTLDASGNLLVGKAAIGDANVGFQTTPAGIVSTSVAAKVDGTVTWRAYSTTDAALKFYVGLGGTVFAVNGAISVISDQRLKENIQDIDVGLDAILKLRPRKYDWKAGKGKGTKGDRGFIAQEFEQVFPDLISEWQDPAPEGDAPYKSVRQDIIPVLVKAIQELTARVVALEA